MSIFLKKCHFAVLIFGLAFLFGCSDNSTVSNPIKTPTEEGSEVDSSDSSGKPGTNSSSSAKGVPGKIVSYSSSSVPGEPPFDISTLPGSYTPSASLNYNVSGEAAFGPYRSGATVNVYGFDATSGKTSPTAVNSKVSNDQGKYTSQGSITSNYAMIEVSGAYYNLRNRRDSEITMKGVVDMQGRTTANVNILTRLAYDRIVYLVAKENKPFAEAKTQAEKEVLAALALTPDDTPFEEITFNTKSQAGANLIIATIILMSDMDTSVTNSTIDAVAADIASDGYWNDMTLKTQVGDALFYVDIHTIVSEFQDACNNNDITVRFISPMNFYGIVNGMGPCDESTDGALGENTNTLSEKKDTWFECRDSTWQPLSAKVAYSKQVAAVLGECNSSKEGQTATYEDSEVLCKGGYWQKITEADRLNDAVAQAKGACGESNYLKVEKYESSYFQCYNSMWNKLSKTPVDYSAGHAMNKKLGRGINFGNSWDAPGTGSSDGGWSNPIDDNWFGIVKNAGFNSIRLPVRWEQDYKQNGGRISNDRLNAVEADVKLAIAQGLTVIVNAHHHDNLIEAAGGSGDYSGEKQKFLNMWGQIAEKFASYSNNVVLEILNEPHGVGEARVNDLMTSAYQVIRSKAPKSTIMFEGDGYSKFINIPKLNLPDDGNIIVTGHYYDPYSFTHQDHGYSYNANATFDSATIAKDFKKYAETIAKTFPDAGGGCVPINMGEFGVNSRQNSGISDQKRAPWVRIVIREAERNGFSWHYWAFSNAGGFQAYGGSWDSNIKSAFDLFTSQPLPSKL